MPFGADEDAFGLSDEDAQRIAQQRMARKQGPTGADRASGALSGGLQGATTGAKLGSVVPGIGTAAGAIVGGLGGALMGGIGAERGQKVGAGAGKQASDLIDMIPKGSADEEVASPFGADTKAFKAKTKGGRTGVMSEMGDWDLPPNDIDYA